MAKTDCKPLPQLSDRDIARFRLKVDKTPGQGPNGDCWLWTGAPSNKGYGVFGVKFSDCLSHRISFMLESGKDPYPLLVLHSCDFPLCCRASHLFTGDQSLNVADMLSKSRNATGDRHRSRTHPETLVRGEASRLAKLTEKSVKAIRSEYAEGLTMQRELAVRFGIDQALVSRIIHRKAWTHVP